MSLKEQWRRLKWSLMSEKKKQKLLDEACNLMRLWPETSELLDLARAQGVGIRFDDSLEPTDTDGIYHRNRTTGECYIGLKPRLDPRDIAIPLIHELRHLWQEKQLGLTPETAGLCEKDARMALIVTRVKEADAFAFTDLMIGRMNNALQDARDARALEKKLLAQAGLKQPTPALEEQVEDFLADRIVARIAGEKKKMEENFLKHLKTLDSYDAIAASGYFSRYIYPAVSNLKHLTEKDGPVVGVPEVRRLLKTGVMESMPPYLDGPGNGEFADMVLAGVKPGVLEAVSLIDAFEKAAARGLPAKEAQEKRAELREKVAAALKR
ncbi:MAG: hypothetical protein EPN97_11590 [Alphaproteobacteria bacterium]|nr:MAG: hypothetical protein EPN97_11590 [Alphaproteobacteria bacterium]